MPANAFVSKATTAADFKNSGEMVYNVPLRPQVVALTGVVQVALASGVRSNSPSGYY